MTEIVQQKADLPTDYSSEKGLKKVAIAEAAEKHFARPDGTCHCSGGSAQMRGSHCGAAAFEVLSCGRDRVRWPVPLVFYPREAGGRVGRV